MQVKLDDMLSEYRDHVKLLTDDLLLHKAALKNLEADNKTQAERIVNLEKENGVLKEVIPSAED